MIRLPLRINFRLSAREHDRYAELLGQRGCATWSDVCRLALEELHAAAVKEGRIILSDKPGLVSKKSISHAQARKFWADGMRQAKKKRGRKKG